MRQKAADVGDRVDDWLASGLQHHREVPAAHRVELGSYWNHSLRGFDADLAPLIDQPGTNYFVGLVDATVEQFELQVLLARLLQQTSSLGTRFLNVGSVADHLLQLLLGGRQG